MPQLNPTPWFAILIFTWMTFIIIIPQKVMKHNLHNDPTSQATKKPEAKSWGWPWY